MKSEQVKELARKITDRVARDSISIAIARNDMKWDKEDCTEEEIITDTLNVVLGDDTGCLDEDELTPGNCSVKFVEAALEQAEREAVGQGGAEFPKLKHQGSPYIGGKLDGKLTIISTELFDKLCAYRDSLAAPRPEASMRELKELLEKHEYMYGGCLCRNFKLPNYGKKELEEFRARGGDWLQDIRWHYWLEHLEAALAAQPEPNDAKHQCPNCGTEITVGQHSKLQGCWPGQPSLEKLRELEALRDEMWKASDNRFAANYAIQTPGEFSGYVIPADKAQEWADRLRAVLTAFEKEGK